MNCSKYPAMLSRHLDGELLPWEAAEVEVHVAQCAGCHALREDFRLQGMHLRSHLGRHRLGEDFVKKVALAASASRSGAGVALSGGAHRKSWVRWLPAAAAIALAAVVVSLYFSGKNSVSYARVIDPGAMEVLQSKSWVHATAGELLHPGEWLRNPVPGIPEILWRDSWRLTLETGALAHIPDSPALPHEPLVLMAGSLTSEIQGTQGEFQVRLPAGTVTSAAGRFTVRATNRVLPRLQVAADRSEILTGTVVPIGEVSVGEGVATVQMPGATRAVAKGTGAVFSRSEFASTIECPAPIEAGLKVRIGAMEAGSLETSMSVAQDHFWIDIKAANISLRRLLTLATSAPVRGGEGIQVDGRLRFPADASTESVISAIGTALGIVISYREEKTSRAIATGPWTPATTPDWAQGEFTFARTLNGSLTFDFRAVPAGQVFRILRMAVDDLPEISAETASVPVTLQAEGLNPRDTAAWLGKALSLQFKTVEHMAGVIEVGNAPASPRPAETTAGDKQQARDAQPIPRFPEKNPSVPGTGSTVLESAAGASASLDTMSQPRAQVMRPLWSALTEGPIPAAWEVGPGSVPGGSSVATGKTTPKKLQFLGARDLLAKPGPSTHLIWPALGRDGALGAEPGYRIVNLVELPARTLWHGFDREGNLIAQYDIRVNGASTLTILPTRDLPSFLGEGGHWETISNLPLTGARESGLADGLGLPVGVEHLLRQWAFPSSWLGLGARVWVANPGEGEAAVAIAIMRNGTNLMTERFDLPPHGAVIWPGSMSGMGPGLTVVVHVLQGAAVSGLK